MNGRELTCPMCFYRSKTKRSLISHCLIKHRCDGNFIAYCNVDCCMYSTRSWNAFKIHIRRKHPDFNINHVEPGNMLRQIVGGSTSEVEEGSNCSDDNERCDLAQNASQDDKREAEQIHVGTDNESVSKTYFFLLAKHFMSLETDHKMSKNSIDNICASITELMISVVGRSMEKLEVLLSEGGLPDNERGSIISEMRQDLEISIINPCSLFSTSHSRQKMYENHCGLLPPKPVFMGHKLTRKHGKLTRSRQFGYYVPASKLIEKLLNLPEIWYYFRHPRESGDDVMRDVGDGRLVKEHPLNCQPDNFLKISLYYDDVEIQNPLRSSAKYKLAMFYMQLLNIPVAFRSQLSSIFLVAMCKSKFVSTFGLKDILQDFIETMSKLRGDGLDLVINGMQVNVKGALLYCLSDTPAAGVLSGFKEGSGFAHRPCRKCYADKNSMKMHFRSELFPKRNLQQHLAECEHLADPLISKVNKAFWSRTYGVNRLSPLCQIQGFDVTKYVIMDTMHILSEGLTGQILALFLHKCIYELELFSLNWLNEQIRSHSYKSVTKGHIPEDISKHHLTVDICVRQKAVAMNTLLSILPQIVGCFFPLQNDHYKHFIGYVKINQLVCTPHVKSETIVLLKDLIENFCKGYIRLYPQASVKPKMHFLVHLVDEMEAVGSLHGVSCLRLEAKHSWFKQIPLSNYRNLSYTFSHKHQMHLCHKMIDLRGKASNNFIYRGDEISEGCILRVTPNSTDLFPLMSNKFGHKNEYRVYETQRVTIRGLTYDIGFLLVIETDELGHPLFGHIDNIIVHEEMKYFLVNVCEAVCYSPQYNSYKLKHCEEYRLINWTELTNKFPLTIHTIDGINMVWCKLKSDKGMEKVLIGEVSSLADIIKKGKKRLNIIADDSDMCVYLEDGTKICDEDDFVDELINGRLLILKKVAQTAQDAILDTTEEDTSTVMMTPPRKKLKVDEWLLDDLASPGAKSESSSSSGSLGSPLEPLELPPFSPAVKCALRDGDSSPGIWNMMVEQMMNFYVEKYPNRLKGTADYKVLGEMMYRRYPCIKRDGRKPWSYLTHILSGRIRTYRHQIKFKLSPEETSKSTVGGGDREDEDSPGSSTSSDSSVRPWHRFNTEHRIKEEKETGSLQMLLSESDYVDMMKEMNREFKKKTPNKAHVKALLKKTFANRRKEFDRFDKDGAPMMSSVLVDWPCFQYGYYVMEEMKLIIGKSDKDMEKIAAKAKKALKAVESMVPKEVLKKKEGEHRVLAMVEYIGCTLNKKGKGKADVPIQKHFAMSDSDIDDALMSLPNTSPVLHCFFSKSNTFEMSQVGGDRQIIDMQANDILYSIMNFISCFFVFNVGFPSEFAPFLGFFQQILLQIPYTEGKKGKIYIETMKEFEAALEAVEEGTKYKKLCV